MHSFVLGELALGNMKDRARTLFSLARLPSVLPARPREVLQLIENARLYGRGIGYADANLLASVRVVPGARLWSNDKRLATVALDLGIGYVPLAEP